MISHGTYRLEPTVTAYVQQHYRTGSAAPTRAEVIYAEISSHLEGPLMMWHRRSWELLTHLHLWVLRDWILSGTSLEERAARCRQAVRAVAPEDLDGSVLMTTLQWARANWYLYNLGRLPVQQTHVPLIQADGSYTLLHNESQCSVVDQAFMDNFSAEQQPHLQHAFLIPLSGRTPPRYHDALGLAMTEPMQRVAEDIEVPVDDSPPSPGLSINPRSSRPAPADPELDHASETGTAELLHDSAPRVPAPPGSAISNVLAGLRMSNPFAQHPPAAAAIPPAAPASAPATPAAPAHSSAAPAASRASWRTVLTRRYTQSVHPEWHLVRSSCSIAGDLQVPEHFLADRPNRLENKPFLDRYLVNYANRLVESTAVPQPEHTYLGFLQWHEINKPSPELEQSMLNLVPQQHPAGQPKNPLLDIHLWDVYFYERYDTISPWAGWLPEGMLAKAYAAGLRRIHQQCFDRIMPQLDEWKDLPLRTQTSKAREAMHAAVTQVTDWRETDIRLQALQPRAKPAAADKPARSSQQQLEVRRPQQQDHQRQQQPAQQRSQQQPREQQRALQQRQAAAASWQQQPASQQQGGHSRSGVTFAEGTAFEASARGGRTQFQDTDGHTWRRDDAGAFATALTPRPASLPPSPPPRPARASNPTFSHKHPQKRGSHRCGECGGNHHVERCPILHPREAPPHWEGTPKGDLHLYCKYVENARRAGMSDHAIRPFIDDQGRCIPAKDAVPAGPLRSSMAPSQDTRRHSPASQRTASANTALRQAVEDDPALDNISRFAFTSTSNDLFQLHYTGDGFEHEEHQPSPAEKQQWHAAYTAAAGVPPTWGEMRRFSECYALTRAQAAQAETDARRAAVSPAVDSPTAPSQTDSTPVSPAAQLPAPEQLPAPGLTSSRAISPVTQPPSRSSSPARVSTTGRLRPPVPFTADPVDPRIPPSQLPDAQRRGRSGYSDEGHPVLPAARLPLPGRAAAAPTSAAAPSFIPAAALPAQLAERFKQVQSSGLSASVQYLLDQGPHIVEQALAANGGVMFSFMDQLHFLPLSQMLVTMPDPASLQPGAPTVSILPAQPTTSNPASATQRLLAQSVDTLTLLCERLEGMRGPVAQAAAAEQLPTSPGSSGGLSQDSVPELLHTSTTTSGSSSPAGSPWLPATPDNSAEGSTQAPPRYVRAEDPAFQAAAWQQRVIATSESARRHVADLTPLQHLADSTGGPAQAAAVWYMPAAASSSTDLPTPAAEQPSLPVCSPPAPAAAEQLPTAASASWPAQSLDSNTSSSTSIDFLPLPSRKRSKQALAARRDSLRAHGILDQVPHVTPVMMLSGLQPTQYMFIQEMGTGRPANRWKVAIFDTGADCALCSTGFAQQNELAYGANPITVNTADGSNTVTLGELNHPLEFWLAKDSAHPCKALSTVQVMAGVDSLFDLLLSTEIITQWSAHICCISSRLVYYPDYWTKGDDRSGPRYLPIMLCRPEVEAADEGMATS